MFFAIYILIFMISKSVRPLPLPHFFIEGKCYNYLKEANSSPFKRDEH